MVGSESQLIELEPTIVNTQHHYTCKRQSRDLFGIALTELRLKLQQICQKQLLVVEWVLLTVCRHEDSVRKIPCHNDGIRLSMKIATGIMPKQLSFTCHVVLSFAAL